MCASWQSLSTLCVCVHACACGRGVWCKEDNGATESPRKTLLLWLPNYLHFCGQLDRQWASSVIVGGKPVFVSPAKDPLKLWVDILLWHCVDTAQCYNTSAVFHPLNLNKQSDTECKCPPQGLHTGECSTNRLQTVTDHQTLQACARLWHVLHFFLLFYEEFQAWGTKGSATDREQEKLE